MAQENETPNRLTVWNVACRFMLIVKIGLVVVVEVRLHKSLCWLCVLHAEYLVPVRKEACG